MLAKLKSTVQSRNEKLVHQILEKDLRLDSPIGGEILWHAVLDDEVEIASMLVRAGANLDIRKPGCALKRSFLHELLSSLDPRHHRLAVLMIDYGHDVNARDAHAHGVLYCVIMAHHSGIGVVRELLKRGSRVTDLDISVAAEHPLAAKLLPLLIQIGNANDDTRKEWISSALFSLSNHYGNESEILPTVKILLDVKLSMEMNFYDRILLHSAILNNKIKMVRLLIAHGFDVMAKCQNKYTALHTACTRGSTDMIRLLVLNGADFNCIEDNGVTPFSQLLTNSEYDLDENCQFAIKQLAVTAAKGLVINKMDLDEINDSDEMKAFYERCQKELDLMKLMTVFSDITFFSVLSKGYKHLSFFTRNDKFVQSYRDFLQKSDFPIFYDELKYVFKAAEDRKNVLLEKEVALCEELDKIMPYLPLEKIIYNLFINEN